MLKGVWNISQNKKVLHVDFWVIKLGEYLQLLATDMYERDDLQPQWANKTVVYGACWSKLLM
jgi:hypothetical protein